MRFTSIFASVLSFGLLVAAAPISTTVHDKGVAVAQRLSTAPSTTSGALTARTLDGRDVAQVAGIPADTLLAVFVGVEEKITILCEEISKYIA